MSLPTSSAKPAQLSIRSFFTPSNPRYTPPPSQAARQSTARASINVPPLRATTPQPYPADDEPQRGVAVSQLPALPAGLPHEASIRPISGADVTPLRRINSLLLQVNFPDSLYSRAVDPAASGRFSRVITWAHDRDEPKVVGGIVCRLEPAIPKGDGPGGVLPQTLYIQSLCLLSPYRSLGLMDAALDNVVATVASDPNLDVSAVTAHVWTENRDGLRWYENRGFRRQGPAIQQYYFKLRPDTAWLVQRSVGDSGRSSLPASGPAKSLASPPAGTTAALLSLPQARPTSGNGEDSAPLLKSQESSHPLPPTPGQSYQKQRAGTEWNDLPDDMATSLRVPSRKGSEPTSSASSRSSSKARKKRDRTYPAAAFGNGSL